ncbi:MULTISPECIES: iron-siderophore ABC transporter substrate-binding protein [unclassified Arthrobacter]|uniref:ABC transporter substrate-binding protein n=1 Tax=unclassified Arthrobacter TaxID=235627 RepID=UPI001490EDE2|nr:MULTISPECIES: iron-siderophore ABC transporter substrate-binding protein [unclassified Arthrobacter]MBE0009688.1 iron-siderophore ABC transporter substrate-binding protein [Arthrobacter sp. AET 35A]NOJ63620.1 iron-siderophore ABC transporter substrate-binding protein [Arthrobacter sp. 147(2020)]
MRKTRLLAVLTAGAMLAISGCGTTEDAASSDASADTGSGESITIVDSRGKEVVLDGPATRVAGSEWGVIENMVSLGVMPVGAADIEGYETWVSSAPLDDTVTDIGTRGEPSIDTLVALEPDLLLVTDSLVDGAIEQIEETIPVIVVPGGDAADNIGQMFETIDLIAKATGTEDAAEELKANFEAKVEEGRAAVEAAGATGDAVAFSDSYVDAGSVSIRPYAEGSLVSDVFAEIGLENAWSMEGDPAYGLAQTDVEGLTELGDAHFWYMANDAFGDPYTDELADNAIWMDLPFVTEDKVVRFPDSIWTFGGPTSMEQIIDAAVDALN